MKGSLWMEIRNERKKGLSYIEIARKHHIDTWTAKKYAESDTKPVYTLTAQKPSKLYPYKHLMDKINLRKVEKDCLISYAGNKYSVPAEYVAILQ